MPVYVQTLTEVARPLLYVAAGSRIGVVVDTHRHLHVWLNGQDLGVVTPHTPLTHPCYAFFDLSYWLKKVCSA